MLDWIRSPRARGGAHLAVRPRAPDAAPTTRRRPSSSSSRASTPALPRGRRDRRRRRLHPRRARRSCPRAAVVLGSGLGGFADRIEDAVEIPFGEIPGWPVSTALGHAGTLVVGTFAGVPVAVMKGRAHLYEGHPADRVVFGVRVLGRLGAGTLVVTNACGGVREDLTPGDLVLVSDHLNLQGQLAARRPERRLARAALSRHERRVRPGAPRARARGCRAPRPVARRRASTQPGSGRRSRRRRRSG